MTPLQEEITKFVVAVGMAFIVIIVCGSIVYEIQLMTDSPIPAVSECKQCHTNFNATENITACESCTKIWSNAYT